MSERIWLNSYPEGVPADIDASQYPSLVALIEESFKKYADRTAYSFMGKDVWWSVPLAVVIGVPMYTNAAGVIPIVQALLAKGAALGTVLAFMMAVIGLSLPETIILRKVLRPPLIAVFVGVVGTGILAVGFIFNALFS